MGIVEKWRHFNDVRDELLIELASTLLLVGFVVGTVDVLTRGGLTALPAFQNVWAIVQALTVDTLFFAVWGRIGRHSWRGAGRIAQGIFLALVGVLLLGVVLLVNGLVNYQQLLNLPNIAEAMRALGIDEVAFTFGRAGLVAVLGVLIAIVKHLGKSEAPRVGEATSAPKLVIVPTPTPATTSPNVADVLALVEMRQDDNSKNGHSPRNGATPPNGAPFRHA